jgi:hypothetical protein
MKKRLLLVSLWVVSIGIASGSLDTDKIDQVTGLKGKLNEKEGVYKVTFPRDDVKVVVGGWTMPPFMGLGTWAAFKETNAGAMVMGDTVLFEDEVFFITGVVERPKIWRMPVKGGLLVSGLLKVSSPLED